MEEIDNELIAIIKELNLPVNVKNELFILLTKAYQTGRENGKNEAIKAFKKKLIEHIELSI